MKRLSILTIVCLFLYLPNTKAQFGSKLKNKVFDILEKSTEEKVEEKTEEVFDKSTEKAEESIKKDNKKTTTPPPEEPAYNEADLQKLMEMMEQMTSNSTPIDYPDIEGVEPSNFIGSLEMLIEQYAANGQRKKDEDGNISWFIDEYKVAIVPVAKLNGEQQDTRMIVNRKKGTMTMLTNDGGEKQGVIMKMNDINLNIEDTELEEEIENTTVKITNETKIIDGYKCKKVLASSDDVETETWITDQVPLSIDKLFGLMSFNIQSKGKNPYEEKFGHIKGLPIESTSKDKTTGEVSKMSIKNIVRGYVDKSKFSTEGYQMSAMPNFSNEMLKMQNLGY